VKHFIYQLKKKISQVQKFLVIFAILKLLWSSIERRKHFLLTRDKNIDFF